MATRPIFIPGESDRRPVDVVECDFQWHPGLAPVQKKKNIIALHDAAKQKGITPVLEVSSKSETELGRRLSAFNLKLQLSSGVYPLESVYQGSKKFERGGPHAEWFRLDPKEAKSAARNETVGRLLAFELEGVTYPLNPASAFYDWIYLRCLAPHAEWIAENARYAGFSDIEFNPGKSISCQARTMALFVWLERRGLLREVVNDFHALIDYLPEI